MPKNRKIVNYRKPFHINIGVILFGIVILYLLLYVAGYATRQHISVYEVEKGHISQNTTYTGLALREEQIFYADSEGQITVYTGDNEKVKYGSLICSIDKEGSMAEKIMNSGMTLDSMDKDDISRIHNTLSQYAADCKDMTFYQVYQFKNDIESNLQEVMYMAALRSLSVDGNLPENTSNFSMVKSPEDGIVSYYVDGFEEIGLDNFETDLFDPSGYSKTNLRNVDTVSLSDPLYKLITSEIWHLLVPVDSKIISGLNLEEKSVVQVTFKKDNNQVWANAALEEYGGQDYFVLTFNNSMVRYASDRYLSIEFQTDTTSGLKIPKSAIIEKDFLVIPKKYFMQGDNSSSQGVMKVSKSMGKTSAEFIATELYYESEDSYYVSEEGLELGDTLQMPDASQTLEITRTSKLPGVYNVNKGYAVFKQISVLAESKEYAIVDSNTSYGVSLYDHIALDGTSISEGELLN